MTNILIDDRAGSKDLINISPLGDIATLARLPYGDVIFQGVGRAGELFDICIEVKSLYDLCVSARENRLQNQVERMLNNFPVNWLFYYGVYCRDPESKGILIFNEARNIWHRLEIPGKKKPWRIPYVFLQSVTIRLAQLGNLNILHVATKENVSEWIHQLHECWQKPFENQTFMKGFQTNFEINSGVGLGSYQREPDDVMAVAKVIAGFRGIAYTLAVRAARYFGSIHNAINADITDWEKIDKIGDGIARSVHRQIMTEIKE